MQFKEERIKIYLNLEEDLKNFSKKDSKYTIPIFIPHRGCKNECVFCNQRKISGVIKEVTVQEVKDIIEGYLSYIDCEKFNRKIEIAFFGGSFTGLNISEQIKFLEIANQYINKGIVNSIKISTRPDYISVPILKIMKKYNVSTIELGVQSLDDEVLKLSKRGHMKKDVIRASKLIHLFNIDLGHQIMVGLPGSTLREELYTIKESLKLNPKILRIYPVYIIEDTELYNMYKSGKYIPLSLNEAIYRTYMIVRECQKTDVNIIRVGLQTTDIITSKNSSIYGPVCDNFAEYVISKIILDKLEENVYKLLKKYKDISDKKIFLDIIKKKKFSSLVVGPKKQNKKYLEEKYNIKIKIKGEI